MAHPWSWLEIGWVVFANCCTTHNRSSLNCGLPLVHLVRLKLLLPLVPPAVFVPVACNDLPNVVVGRYSAAPLASSINRDYMLLCSFVAFTVPRKRNPSSYSSQGISPYVQVQIVTARLFVFSRTSRHVHYIKKILLPESALGLASKKWLTSFISLPHNRNAWNGRSWI